MSLDVVFKSDSKPNISPPVVLTRFLKEAIAAEDTVHASLLATTSAGKRVGESQRAISEDGGCTDVDSENNSALSDSVRGMDVREQFTHLLLMETDLDDSTISNAIRTVE